MIICDSIPFIHLSRIGKLGLLKDVFDEIIIPDAVYIETVIKGREKEIADSENIASQPWIIKKLLSKKQIEEVGRLLKSAKIGLGEAESIVLAKSESLGLVIDDSVGVKVAEMFGIETYWTTSVVLKAVSDKLIKKVDARSLLEELIRTGYRLKPEILIQIFEKLG